MSKSFQQIGKRNNYFKNNQVTYPFFNENEFIDFLDYTNLFNFF